MILAAAGVLAVFAPASRAAPPPSGFEKVSPRVWAFVARDERSANGALFIGSKEALVVDPGLTPTIAQRFLDGVRALTDRPIRTIVLTHWHPDHALGIACLAGTDIALAATPATRRALAENLAAISHSLAQNAADPAERDALNDCAIRLPDTLIDARREFDLGGHVVQVSAPGVAHTDGDLVVYSPHERVLVSGDLFLNRSSPDMKEGRVAGLLDALDRLLALPIRRVIPGHFEVSDKAGLARFRDYVRAVHDSARAVVDETVLSATVPAALAAFTDFRQFPQYEATFADNLRAAAAQYRAEPAKPGASNGFRLLRRLKLGQNPHQIAFSPDGHWAYVAIAGDDRIARVDVASLTEAGAMPVADAPLGVHALATDDLLITRFGGETIERRRWGVSDPLTTLPTGIGTSLFSGTLPDGSLLASVERNNTLLRFARDSLAPIASFTTGARPFPPAATADGRLAFVPNYDDASVSVIDLWNGTVRATVAVGAKPSGGTVLPGDGEYAVAVRGENRIAFINTASKQVVGSLADGIGQSPFSVVLAPNGRLAFVNNTASHGVSVIALPEKRVIARIPTGEIPIVMAVHPSGETLWVSCEGTHELDIIAIPRAWREPAPDLTPAADTPVTEVAVLGMIHDKHRTSSQWGLDAVRDTITRFHPDVVIAEIPPDRWQRIWRDYAERGVIEDSRVLRFPEYTDVLLPLKLRMGFAIEPGAAWTQEMSDLREARIHVFEHDAAFAERNVAYQAAVKTAEAQDTSDVTDLDDPRVIHTDAYDRMTKIALTPYDEYLNDVIGPGGWTNINVAHYRLIDAAIRHHPGKRILITFGAGHKYWLLDRLRERDDIRLSNIDGFESTP
jgi:YVTN family beta-propeller protein